MSPAFQETLRDNEMLLNSHGIISLPSSVVLANCGILRNTLLRHNYYQTQRHSGFFALPP